MKGFALFNRVNWKKQGVNRMLLYIPEDHYNLPFQKKSTATR